MIKRKVGRPKINLEDSSDPKQTGRTRALRMYPINPDADCEWQGFKNCGGGKYPIIGCFNGKQQHRHHGPDKNTFNNDRRNVSLICGVCHNRWHTMNDVDHEVIYTEKVIASPDELVKNELDWQTGKYAEFGRARIEHFKGR